MQGILSAFSKGIRKIAYSKGSQSQINTKRILNQHYKMKAKYFKAFAIFGILLASTLAYPVSLAQASEIALSLDKRVYTVGDSVIILGLVQSPSDNVPAIVQVWNPNNEACSFQQLIVNDDGSFTARPIKLTGKVCSVIGTFTVNAFYGELEGSTSFEVQPPTTVQGGRDKIEVLIDILNKAKQNVGNKIADVKSKGIEVPADIMSVYEEGLSEAEQAAEAADSSDADSVKEHAKKAMAAFREVFAVLTSLEEEGTEETEVSEAEEEVEKGLEKAEKVSSLRQAIARAKEFAARLANIAETSDVSIGMTDFNSTITEAAKLTEEGDVDGAAKALAKARQILNNVHESLKQNAQEQRVAKAKGFVTKAVEIINQMIANAEEIGIPEDVIDSLKVAKQKLLDAKTVGEIIKIAKELKDEKEQFTEQKGKNFERALQHVESRLQEMKGKAEQAGLNLGVFDRIQGLIDDAKAKWESGETGEAVKILDKAEQFLREVANIMEHVRDKLHELNRLAGAAEELKGKVQDNPEALNAIDKALRLIAGAKETLLGATSKDDLEIAHDMAEQAKHILERIKNSEIEKKFKTDFDGASKIEKFVGELEHKARTLKKTAEEQGNGEALAVIQQAVDLIMKAKQMVSEENYDRAKALLKEANDLLNKAERMLKGDSDVNTAPVEEVQADAITKEIQVLEAVAADLKSMAGDNEDALEEIEEALSDIEDAKKSVSEGKIDKAKQKVSDAKEHLRKAKKIIEGEEYEEEEERKKKGKGNNKGKG